MNGKPTRPKVGRPTRGRPAAARPAGKSQPAAQRAPVSAARRTADTPPTLLERYRPDLAQMLAAADMPAFRYAQVLEHLFRRPNADLDTASNLPADLRSTLAAAGSSVLELVASREASDGTTKLLLAAADGARVETVSMPYGNRMTVCVSSQVGCPVGCAFCATGGLGFSRNLTTAEIVDQLRAAVVAARPEQRLTNVVYMGMGEPLLNLGAVLDSVRLLTAPSGLGLGHRSISISTVGIPNGILRLAKAEPQVNLALSLHAADDATRALLIPERYRHPIQEILEAAWQHFAITRRKLLVEYVLIGGVNDSVDDARRLAGLLRGHVVAVNLLAWNPVAPESGPGPAGRRKPGSSPLHLAPSSPAAIAAFRATLRASHIEAVLRQSKGAGIEAACGQLAASARSYDEM
jgi:23S rRNA (adenine2503-C2)-methyltransferase